MAEPNITEKHEKLFCFLVLPIKRVLVGRLLQQRAGRVLGHAGGVVRPILLLMRGRRSRRRSAVDRCQYSSSSSSSSGGTCHNGFVLRVLTKPNSAGTRRQNAHKIRGEKKFLLRNS